MRGIHSIGWYVPRHRLDRGELAALCGLDPARGTRSIGSYDEDPLTMGVAALRAVVSEDVRRVFYSTTRPTYLDKGVAPVLALASGCAPSVGAYDVIGSARSGVAALLAALDASQPAVAVLADQRYGRPGSADDSDGGDAACAIVCGDDPIAELIGSATRTDPLMDRWRVPGEPASRVWDQRWAADELVPLMLDAADDVLKQTGLVIDDIAHVVVASPSARAAAVVPGRWQRSVAPSRAAIGYSGSADLGVQLAEVLATATAGDHVLVVNGVDGADALLFRVGAHIDERRPSAPSQAIASPVSPATYLIWRGLLDREPPRRPDPIPPASPPASRNKRWKYAFVGSECERCGWRSLPPQRVCTECGSVDQSHPVDLSRETATIRTWTTDHLAFSPAPPVVVAVIDFDGGGRYRCQLTDVDPDRVAIGDRVEMVFRIISDSANGVRNYFWKARPIEVQS